MAIEHMLEDFSAGPAANDVMQLMSDVALEDQRLASFEQGYSAGWEDAFAAQEKDQTRITGDLADSLSDLSFTYNEAMTQFLASLEPVFQSLVALVLPDIMNRTFGQHVVDLLHDMARDQASGPVNLVVPEGAGATLSSVLTRDMAMPVVVRQDPEMDKSRACLRLGTSEREMDASALLDRVGEIIEAFTFQTSEALKNG